MGGEGFGDGEGDGHIRQRDFPGHPAAEDCIGARCAGDEEHRCRDQTVRLFDETGDDIGDTAQYAIGEP